MGAEQDTLWKRSRRPAVSSESDDPHKVDIVTHAKSDHQKTLIKSFILSSDNFLFRGLSDAQVDLATNAMFETRVKAGDVIIQQGEDGDNFYLVGEGELDVFVLREGAQAPELVTKYGPSGTFGELALMYLCPRAATVKATTDCILWCLDRTQFRALMCMCEEQFKPEWIDFLDEIEVFKTLNKYERMKLADVIVPELFGCGDDVIVQGDEVTEFMYVIESGTCSIQITDEDGISREIRNLGRGDYFGELALLEGCPRSAGVKVTSAECHLLNISSSAFNSILPSAHAILKQNLQRYEKAASP